MICALLFLFVAYVTTTITRFISFEVFWWSGMLGRSFLTALRHSSLVVLFVVVVIYLAMKGSGTMKPRAGTGPKTPPVNQVGP